MNKKKALIIGSGIAGPVAALALKRAGLEVEVYEAKDAAQDEAGAFLNLAPNGVNVLKILGIEHRIAAEGFKSAGIALFNARGKQIGFIDSRREEEQYGAGNLMLKRGALNKALYEAARDEGIAIQYGQRLVDTTVTGGKRVIARFENGLTAEGDLLVGCDGIHSRTRQLVLPDGPQPTYTGMIDAGGFGRYSGDVPVPGAQHMTFGRRAFFGYIRGAESVWWFSNVAMPQELNRDELRAIPDAEWRQKLLDLHKDDPSPIPEIIRSTTDIVGKWPVYDMPPLPTWHRGPLVLVGDAAHATSPHIGQGASLALEDALVLALCVRDFPEQELALSAYERLRKERVERLVEQARRTGDRKIPHPLFGWFRDLTLPLFLKAGSAQSASWYSYKVAWDKGVNQGQLDSALVPHR